MASPNGGPTQAARANPQQATVATAEAVPERPTPQEAPPLTNPPATAEQIEQDDAAKARAALGGAPGAPVVENTEEDDGTDDLEEPEPVGPASGYWSPELAKEFGGLHKAPRFQTPKELEFEFTPPEPQQIRNNNVPLTVGLLLSIGASFIVFFVSLGGGSASDDPIMPAFWRALGALAVLVTLSFAASWFMPAPSDHRQLLDRLEAEDRALKRYRSSEAGEEPAQPQPVPQEETDFEAKGTSIDLTVDDDEFEDEDELAPMGQADEDDFDDEDDDDLVATSPSQTGAAPASGAGQ
ncbi:MAG TPA: hypothetical protein VK457_13555 [Chloroflexota bacterium]|nr:hypothetical protein [Chloroflexota bacterium]